MSTKRSRRKTKSKMKKTLMIIAIALFSVAAIPQDRTANVAQISYATTVTGYTTDSGGTGNVDGYPIKGIYTFSNTKPVNLRLSVWIPGSDYAHKVFGNNDDALRSSVYQDSGSYVVKNPLSSKLCRKTTSYI